MLLQRQSPAQHRSIKTLVRATLFIAFGPCIVVANASEDPALAAAKAAHAEIMGEAKAVAPPASAKPTPLVAPKPTTNEGTASIATQQRSKPSGSATPHEVAERIAAKLAQLRQKESSQTLEQKRLPQRSANVGIGAVAPKRATAPATTTSLPRLTNPDLRTTTSGDDDSFI